MNEIEKLIAATEREHDKTKPAAKFFVYTAVFANVVLPVLVVVLIIVLWLFLR